MKRSATTQMLRNDLPVNLFIRHIFGALRCGGALHQLFVKIALAVTLQLGFVPVFA